MLSKLLYYAVKHHYAILLNTTLLLFLQVVGLPAKQGMIRNAKNTVCHVKRLLGREFDDEVVQTERNKSQCQVTDN